MNKKGFTMVELIVSIAMIALIMIFLVKMLVDIKSDSTNELYDTADQINRAEIIKTIENSMKDKTIVNITSSGSAVDTSTNTGSLVITITTKQNYTSTITIDANDNLTYVQKNGSSSTVINKTWAMEAKSTNAETHYQKTNIPVSVIRNKTVKDDCLIILDIPVIVDWFEAPSNADNNGQIGRKNSKMDDITLSFYSNESLTDAQANTRNSIPELLNQK